MRLALGTVQFGLDYGIANEHGRVPFEEARAIVEEARTRGMDTLDTAMAYGDSETRLGRIGVAQWHVVSKLPGVPADCQDVRAWVTASVRRSLAELRIPGLHGLLLHRPGQLLEEGGDVLYRALCQLKMDGLVRKIGVSIYDPAELEPLCRMFSFDLVQAPFNLLDCRLTTSGWMSRLAAQGTELHVRSVFLQGLLLMPAESRPPSFERWSALWAAFHGWLIETGLSPLQACVRYALSVAEISRVVVGVDTREQLMAILHAADGPVPAIPAGLRIDDPDLLNPARWPTRP